MDALEIINGLIDELAAAKREEAAAKLALAEVQISASAGSPMRSTGSALWLAVDALLSTIEKAPTGTHVIKDSPLVKDVRAKLDKAEPHFDTIPF